VQGENIICSRTLVKTLFDIAPYHDRVHNACPVRGEGLYYIRVEMLVISFRNKNQGYGIV